MGIFSGLAKGLTEGTIEGTGKAVSSIIDKVVTKDSERMELKTQLTSVITNFVTTLVNAQRDILTTEMKGNWLQRSWRPIVMLAFAFIVVYEYFLAKIFALPPANLPEYFWDLLKLGMGGYVIGRSVEKTVGNITSNIDVIPGKRKKK